MGAKVVALNVPETLGPSASFGVAELTRALEARGYQLTDGKAEFEIVCATTDSGAASLSSIEPCRHPESYAITRRAPGSLAVVGNEGNGLMVACLDLAEQLEMGADLATIAERDASPELAVRGLYTFVLNTEAERKWLYDPDYWQCYADELARWRYNRFNLVYGHQTAHLIPIYAHMLDDLDGAFPEIRVTGITARERADNLQALQTASAAMASRGITFMLGIWQARPWLLGHGTFPSPSQPARVSGTEDLARLAEYTRRGFALLMERCPHVDGIQLRMNPESGVMDQRFFVRSFVPVLKDLASEGRRLIVELRSWGLNSETVSAFQDIGTDVIISAKYFAEHQAMPYQPPSFGFSYSYGNLLRRDRTYPFLWQFWNLGSHRLFNWGDPEYARRFARSCHLGDGVGFEVTPPGSQKGFSTWGQVTPGDWNPRSDLPELRDFDRYWFFHMAFGRAGYDSNVGDEIFLHQLTKRSNAETAPVLLDVYHSASQVISYLISHRMDDPNMYVWPELDCGGPIDHNAITPAGEKTLFSTPREYAEARVAGHTSAKLSPFDVAVDLERFADETEAKLAELAGMTGQASNLEVRTVREDSAALAALARYHAAKARATGNLSLFYASGERRFLGRAELDATDEIRLWDELCARTENYYRRLHLGPTRGHWRDNRPRVRYDLRRIHRVQELFDGYGGFVRGFHFGQPRPSRATFFSTVWKGTGLEPEPRFIGVQADTRYASGRGYGWLEPAGLRSIGLSGFDWRSYEVPIASDRTVVRIRERSSRRCLWMA